MQNAAFILIGVGILILIGWGVKGFFMDADVPVLIRIAVGAIRSGPALLLGRARGYGRGTLECEGTACQRWSWDR